VELYGQAIPWHNKRLLRQNFVACKTTCVEHIRTVCSKHDFSKFHNGAFTVPDNTNIRTLPVQGVPRTDNMHNEGIKGAF
jgi:hypothetical protein